MDYKPKDIDLNKCNLPYEDEINLSQFETTDTMPIVEPLYQDNSKYEKLFKGLSTVVKDLESLKVDFYAKSGEMGDAIMPLSVEAQKLPKEQNILEGECFKLVMEQNYIQNGDLMSEPRIDFAIYPAMTLAVPLDFEQHNMGIYSVYVDDGKVISASGIKSTIDFCLNAWFPNLVSTDRIIGGAIKEDVIEASTVIKDEEPTINTIGDLYFHNNESHILGKMSLGFRNMIIVEGSVEDAKKYFEGKFKDADLINGDIENIEPIIDENSIYNFNGWYGNHKVYGVNPYDCTHVAVILLQNGYMVQLAESGSSINITKNGNTIYVNDNGGELNLGTFDKENNKPLDQISNIPYHSMSGVVKPEILAEMINDDFEDYFKEVQEHETMPTKQEIEKAIKGLEVLAKYGNEDAVKAIKGLKLLLE
jgi:hypothetical protein